MSFIGGVAEVGDVLELALTQTVSGVSSLISLSSFFGASVTIQGDNAEPQLYHFQENIIIIRRSIMDLPIT